MNKNTEDKRNQNNTVSKTLFEQNMTKQNEKVEQTRSKQIKSIQQKGKKNKITEGNQLHKTKLKQTKESNTI